MDNLVQIVVLGKDGRQGLVSFRENGGMTKVMCIGMSEEEVSSLIQTLASVFEGSQVVFQ